MTDFSDAFAAAIGLVLGLDTSLTEIVGLSLRVSLTAVAIAAFIGLPVGAAIALFRFPGRFFFVGGISPLSTRSKIFTHWRKVSVSERSCPSFSKFSGVSVSLSWQSMQDASIKGATASLKVSPFTDRLITSDRMKIICFI